MTERCVTLGAAGARGLGRDGRVIRKDEGWCVPSTGKDVGTSHVSALMEDEPGFKFRGCRVAS